MEWADLGPGRWLRREKKSSNKIESTRLSARQAGDGSHPEAADAVAQGAQCHNRAGGRHGSPAKLETTTSRCRRQRMRAWPGSGRPAGSSWLGLIVLLWSLCLPCALPVNSPGDNTCVRPASTITALLLQKKGPETIIFEANVSSGGVTGLRKALKLHDQALSGFAVDPVRQRVHMLTSAPGPVVHNLELKDEAVSYLGNSSIFEEVQLDQGSWLRRRLLSSGSGACGGNSTEFNGTTNCSISISEVHEPTQQEDHSELPRRELRNVWNLAAWESQGLLLAITPRDAGFNTSVIVVNPLSGRANAKTICQGSPVRGIFTFDRREENYFFVTTAKRQRNLAVFHAPEGRLAVKSLSLEHGELIGLHYDEGKCRLLAVGLRSPGVLSIQSLDLSGPFAIATEVVSLTEAASPTAKAFELVGMTSLVAGQDVSYLLCRDPHSSTINVYNLDADQWYAMEVASDGIVALQARVRLNPRVLSIEPSEVGMAGSSPVTVFGTDFGRADMSPGAFVGNTISPQVSWTSDSSIVVRAPASPLKSAEFPLKLNFGEQDLITEMKVDYVPSWISFEPTKGSVVGGQTITIRGGRFGAGPFRCKFGAETSDGTAFGIDMVTCLVPPWPQGAAMVQLDLLSNDALIKRDTQHMFSYVAGDAAQIAVIRSTATAFGGRPFEVKVALQDSAGNTVLDYNGVFRLQVLEWSGGGWSELPIVEGAIQSVEGRYVESAVHGAANFSIAIAGHGNYSLNISTEACSCGELGCSEDDANWDGDFWGGAYGGCETYAPGQVNGAEDGDFCFFDHACEACACRCSRAELCSLASGATELGVYGICTIDSSDLADFSHPRQIRHVSGPCFAVSTEMQVAIGQMAVVNVSAPDRALAAHLLVPQPRVEILDSGGNIANVQVEVFVFVEREGVYVLGGGSAVNTSAGVAIFTDVKISAVGSFSLVFFTMEEGLRTGNVGITVLHSSPAYLFNAGLYPSRSHMSMRPMQPAPVIWILDEGGNQIDNTSYWIQDSFGVIASRPLNVSIKASLSSVFQNTSSGMSSNPFGNIPSPFSLPSEVIEPVGHLYGSTTIAVLGEASGAVSTCVGNCSGHGQCQLFVCSCQTGWRGAGCQLPDESIACGEDCPASGLGHWEHGQCLCLSESLVNLHMAQIGIEASFSELFVDAQGKGFVLTFAADGLMPVQSFAFAVEPGVARHLYVIIHPMNGTGGGGFFNAPVVEIRDAGKNLVELEEQGGRRNVSVHLLGNANGTLSGAQVRLATAGCAIFGGLRVDRISDGIPYILKFTSEGLFEAFSYPFAVVPGSPYSLGIVYEPHGARGGLFFATQPELQVLDRGGNRVPTGIGWTVTAKIDNITTYGNLRVPLVAGLAQFTDLRVDTLGQMYMTFDSQRNLEPLYSEPFNVTAGPPAIVVILVQPGNGIGGLISRQPKIYVLDGGGNRVTEGANVSVSARGNASVGASGDFPVGLYQSSGYAMNFTDLEVVAPAPNSYQLVFSVTVGEEYLSDFFNISVGVPVKLDLQIQPSDPASAGGVLLAQPVVHVVDRAGNLVLEDNILVSVFLNTSSLSKYENPFVSDLVVDSSNASGCNTTESAHRVQGTLSISTESGVAAFTDLDVGLAGMGSRLVFEASMLQSVDSQPFEITLGQVAVSLRVFCSPQNEFAGISFARQPILQVLDLGGNRMHGQDVEATASLLSPSPLFPGFLAGRLTTNLRGDLLAFTDLALDTAGDGFRIRFEAPGLQAAMTNPVSIVGGVAVALNVDSLTAVRVFETFNVTVSLRDQGGNPVPPSQPVNISAQLYKLEARTFTVECKGLHSCDSDFNLTLPSGFELFSVTMSANLSCTDFDSPDEQIIGVTVGSYELDADVEYERGPWPGCFRNCIDSRPVVHEYDAMRKFCWDSRGLACNRVLYHSAWDAVEPRWEFLSRVLGQHMSILPFHIEVPETVNFNPCDGNFVNAIIEVTMEYLVPDITGILSGRYHIEIQDPASSVVFDEFALPDLNERFVLGFVSPGLQHTFSDVFTLSPGQVTSFRILQQPGNGTGGTVLDAQPILELQDFGGNKVVHASGLAYTITASVMAPCSASTPFPIGGSVVGNSSIHPSNGIAVFTDLLVGKKYDQYIMLFKLVVDDSSLVDFGASSFPADEFFVGNVTSIENSYVRCRDCFCSPAERPCISCDGPTEPSVMISSSAFSVAQGPPNKLEIELQPGDGKGGESLMQQPVIKVVDLSGNFNPDVSGSVISAAIDANGGVVGQLTGDLSVEVVQGKAQFANLVVDKAGELYTFVFSSPGLTALSSNPFNVLVGDGYQLIMIRQPSDGIRDLLLSSQPAVQIQDRGGNSVVEWQGNVSVAMSGGAPLHPKLNFAGAQLLGTLDGYNHRGSAYWYNLQIDLAGKDFVLNFTASGLLGCSSGLFLISGKTATNFKFVTIPSIARSFFLLPEIAVGALDPDGYPDVHWTQELSLDMELPPGSTAQFLNFDLELGGWINGIALFGNTLISISKDEIISFNLRFGDDFIPSGNLNLIDPFTGWWNLGYAGLNMQLSMKGEYLIGKTSGEWTDKLSGSRFSLVSDHAPVYEARGADFCLSFVATVSTLIADGSSGEGEGSLYLQQCSRDAIATGQISTRTSNFNLPDTSWARDVKYFRVEEHYPEHAASHYVVVANGFNSSASTYTANSAMYKWHGGQLHLHQTFPNTKSAYSIRYFEMGSAHYIVIANHFDDKGNGYGVPSVLYRHTWVGSHYEFVPVQSISTEGAVEWEYFELNGEGYMIVANYFNGTDYAINSTVYLVARNNPDAPVPGLKQLQAIGTNGARDVAHFAEGNTQYLAFANWRGETVDVYRSTASVPHFLLIQTLQVGPATGVELFAIDGETYLAVSISDQDTARILPRAAQIYHYNPAHSLFEPFQNLRLSGLQRLRYYSDGADFFLSLIELNEGGNVDARTRIYSWNGTNFREYLSLPTRNASAVVIMDVPCDLTNAIGTPGACSEKNEQRLIMAVNGKGQGSEIFSLFSLESRALATHLSIPYLYNYTYAERPLLNQTILPYPTFPTPPQVDLYLFEEPADIRGEWDVPIQVDIQVWSQDSPVGEPYQMRVPAFGMTSAFANATGTSYSAYFYSLRTIDSGVISLHASNKYLSDLSYANSAQMTILPGTDYKLMVHDVPSQVISGHVFAPLLSVHDVFGNFKRDASIYTVNATLRSPPASILVYNTTAQTKDGVARFGVLFFGNEKDLTVEFTASGLLSVVTVAFDVVGRAFVQDLGALAIQAGATVSKLEDGGVVVFGGITSAGTVTSTLMKVEAQLPFQIEIVPTAGQIPPARFHHVALILHLSSESMIVLGGEDGNGLLQNDGVYALDIQDGVWTYFSSVTFPGRAQHSAVNALLVGPDPNQPSSTQVTSLIVVYGGQDASGQALDDLLILRVLPRLVENSPNPAIVSGDKPSSRYGAFMTWNTDRGYLLGGKNSSDDAIYSFNITYQGRDYYVHWSVLSIPGTLSSPHPFVGTPLRFLEKLHILTRPNGNVSNGAIGSAEMYTMDPTTGQEVQWLKTLTLPDIIPADYYALAEISEGRALVYSSDFSSFATHSYLISLVTSVALEMQYSPPSQISAGGLVFPAPSVVVLDANGDVVKDAGRNPFVRVYAYDSNMDPIPLAGDTRVRAVNGVAVFDFLILVGGSSGSHFVFESDCILGVSSITFDVTQGGFASLSIVQEPAGFYLGSAFLVQPSVSLEDVAGNRVVDNSFSLVGAFLEYKQDLNDPWVDKTAWLTGEKSMTPINGILFYEDLGLSIVAQQGYYRLIARAPGITSGVAEFALLPNQNGNSTGPGTTAFLSIQPLACRNTTIGLSERCSSYLDYANSRNAMIAGVPLRVQPSAIVKIPGASTLFITGEGVFFDVKLVPAVRNELDLNGTKYAELNQGRLNFTDLSVNPVGSGYRLVFTSSILPTAQTVEFAIVPGTPATMAMPSIIDGALAGLSFQQQPSILVSDVAENLIVISVSITAILNHPTANAILKGNPVATTVQGRAVFTDLTIDPVEVGYTIQFTLYDTCCGASLDIESPRFNVTQSGQASLEENARPAGGIAGGPFLTQPSVAIRDFGGNLLSVNGTVVTASIERDSTTIILPSKVLLASGNVVSCTLYFKVNMTEYLFVANLFDGTTYSLNSTLYVWDATNQVINEIQQIPTQGAEHLTHFIQEDEHYVVVANSFEVVTIESGQIEGTYNTLSKVYRMDSGKLVFVASIPTHGVKAIETMQIAGTTMILVANNYDDNSTLVNSVVYQFNPHANASSSHIVEIQHLPTTAAALFHYFKGTQGEDLVIAALYYDSIASTYTAESTVYRFRQGMFEIEDTILTSGVVSIKSFWAGSRKYVAVGNAFGLNSTSDSGVVVVYEHVQGKLLKRQQLDGFAGLTDIVHFHSNGAEWLVMTTDPLLAGSGLQGASSIYSWDTSNCTTQETLCDEMVDFTFHHRLNCTRCASTTHFESGWDNHYVVSASASDLSVFSFYSEGALRGNAVVPSVNGIIQFTDLYIDLKNDEYSLSYRSENLQTAYGGTFSVTWGPLATIRTDTYPLSGIAAVPFDVQPIVVLRDLGGNLMPYQHDGNYITVSISTSGAVGSQLTGSTSALIQDGRALYTNLGITLVSWHVLNFTYSRPSEVVLFDSFMVTIAGGKSHHMEDRSPAEYLYGGMVFAKQPSFFLVDAGGNFAANGSTQVGVTLTSHQGFDVLPLTDISDFQGLISTGVEFFSYFDLGYVVAFGTLSSNNVSTMRMYKWGCNSLIPVQTWNTSVSQVSFWKQQGIPWMVVVSTDYSCELLSFDPANEKFIVRGYFTLRGIYQVLPIQLGSNVLHFAAAVDASYEQGHAGIVLLAPSIMLPAGNSMNDMQNLTLEIRVLQNITSAQSVAKMKTFGYGFKEWLVVLADSTVLVYRWGEYIAQYFHLHDSKTVANVLDMAIFFTEPAKPPVVAFAGQTSFMINLEDDSAPRGISLESNAVTLPFADAQRIRSTRKGNDDVLVMASLTQVAIAMGNITGMNITWCTSTSSSVAAVEWGWSEGSLYLLTVGSPSFQNVFNLKDRGELSGATIVTAASGVASFTDLQIDLLGDYTLSFSALGLQNDFSSQEEFDVYQLQSEKLTVQLGNPSAIVIASSAAYGTTPAVKLVDTGGNDITVGATKTRITVNTAINSEFNISGSIRYNTSKIMHTSCILACRAEFPQTPSDGMLWHLGGGAGQKAAWLGIRDSATQSILRVRVGADSILTPATLFSDILFVDIKDFPRDGYLHDVVVEVALDHQASADASRLWLRLYIDGEQMGAAFMNSDAWLGSGGLHSFGLAADDGIIPAGEPNRNWPGATSPRLKIYENTDWDPACDTSVLLGDWVTGSESSLKYICCGEYGCPKVTAILENPAEMSSQEEVQKIYSSGVRDVEHFTIGSQHFVAVANNFDGVSYLIDSLIYEWKNSELQAAQGLTTKGAYDFEFFTMYQTNASGIGHGDTVEDYYLLVANHFDEADGYLTLSTIYKWNATLSVFEVFQNIPTEGATHWTAFKIEGEQYLAVSNFFDGSFHSVDSVVYRWSAGAQMFTVVQRIATVGAHSVQHSEHAGELFLFFAQFRQSDEVSLAIESPIYMWDSRVAQFKLLTSFTSSAAMHVEPFEMSGDLYFAVANYANSTTGNLITQSPIYKLSCSQGIYRTALVQTISTYGGVYMKHFTRGGIEYLALSNWRLGTSSACDGMTEAFDTDSPCESSIELYLWNGASFELYHQSQNPVAPSPYQSGGAFSLDVMLFQGRYYILSAMVEDRRSVLDRFGAGLDTGQLYNYTSVGFLWDGPTAFPELNRWLDPNSSAPSQAQQNWGIEFVSLPLTGTATGPYYNATQARITTPPLAPCV